MDLQQVIDECLELPGAEETTPFGPEALVYKVGGKMFAILAERKGVPGLNLKCEPDRALELRDRHEGIAPGWHMNKKHWNTVALDGSVNAALIREMIQESYTLVVAGLSRNQREALEGRRDSD